MLRSKKQTKPYTWGSNCTGWPLVQTDGLSVIEELMPPGTSETMHLHRNAQQFFRILSGTATFEIANATLSVPAGSGIHIPPNTWHRIINTTELPLEFLVVSQPSTQGDRVERTA